MRSIPIAVATAFLFMPPACMFTPLAVAQAERDTNSSSQPSPSADNHKRKVLTVKGGTLLNSNPTPEEAKKTAEATNRQVLEKQRKR